MTVALKMEVRGINNAIQNLIRTGEATEQAAAKGVLAGALLIQRRAQLRTPVEYGFLRASAFARRVPGQSVTAEVGFGAAYALFVHEKTGEKLRGKPRPSGLGTYWNPGESQFLLKAVTETRIGEIVSLISAFMRRDQRTSGGAAGGAA